MNPPTAEKPHKAARGKDYVTMKKSINDFSIDEAIRTLSAYGLEEVQKVLELSDDDIVEILLNNYSVWEQKLINWFINYLNDSAIELNENKYL